MNVLSVASEVFPLVKTGGLADVTGALPVALGRLGVGVRTMLPAYPAVKARLPKKAKAAHEYRHFFGGHARIVDGDSLVVAGVEIRLFGIDAPELGARGGREAAEALVQLVEEGMVRCAALYRDRYARTVATCEADGVEAGGAGVPDLGEAMLRLGRATHWRRYTCGDARIDPAVCARYDDAEAAARISAMGVWAPHEAPEEGPE